MAEVTLTVVLVEGGGGVSVTGPIHNKILCYGMLEAAKEAIMEHQRREQDRRIQLASPADLPQGLMES